MCSGATFACRQIMPRSLKAAIKANKSMRGNEFGVRLADVYARNLCIDWALLCVVVGVCVCVILCTTTQILVGFQCFGCSSGSGSSSSPSFSFCLK